MLNTLIGFMGPILCFPALAMQNLLACKFVGNCVLVFSEMRAMGS